MAELAPEPLNRSTTLAVYRDGALCDDLTHAELERKRANDALRESEERYRAFIAASQDAMWRIESDQPISLDLSEDEQIDTIFRYGRLAECNEIFCSLVGATSPDEIAGTQFAVLFPPADERLREEVRLAVPSRYRPATYPASSADARPDRRHYVLQ